MQRELTVIPSLAIHPDRINLYNEIHWTPSYTKPRANKNFLESDKKHKGKVSNNARRKIDKAITYLLFLANDKQLPDTAHGKSYNFKVAFVTLTLPSIQRHSDNEIKDNCLNQLLVELRKWYHVKNYIWRSEKQKNGNIHFHILIDKFIPWSELRDRWNRIINKLGYVDGYRNNMREFHKNGFKAREDLLQNWDREQQIKAYQKGKANDWNSPNTTDIHSLYRIGKVKNYLSKYYGKDEQNEGLTGRMWGCNYELSNVKGGQCVADSFIKDEIEILKSSGKCKFYTGDYFTVVFCNAQELLSLGCVELYKLFSEFIFQHFGQSVQTVNSS